MEEISSILKSVLGDLINNIKKALEGVDLKIVFLKNLFLGFRFFNWRPR